MKKSEIKKIPKKIDTMSCATDEGRKMTLIQHFSELRRRVIYVLLIFSVLFGGGWILSPILQQFLSQPLLSIWANGSMLYTGLTDGLMIQFQLATLFAIVGTLPVLLWHVWAFVGAGLKQNEKKFIAPVLIVSPLLFISGAAFAFYVLFPVAFKFFVELNGAAPVPTAFLPAMKDYLSLTISLLKIFGIAFQLPLVLVVLNRLGLLSRAATIRSRRYTIVVIFIAAAILTPTSDIVSQFMLAIPLWILFEASIWFMKK